MSFCYAYYRFGEQLLPTLPDKLQRTVRRFRQLYDMGLHGPDVFHYANPLHYVTAASVLKKYRGQTGKAFFERVGRMLRLQPTEGAMAYLCGLLAHYALRSLTTPYLSRQGDARTAVETEFDRYLLELDGKGPTHVYDRSGHIRMTPGECSTAASFYPPATSGLVESCTKTMAQRIHSLALPQGTRRTLLEKTPAADLLMPLHPRTADRKRDTDLARLFELALSRYALLLEEMQAYLRRGTPLGTDFSAEFC